MRNSAGLKEEEDMETEREWEDKMKDQEENIKGSPTDIMAGFSQQIPASLYLA